MNKSENNLPKWQKEIKSFKGIKSTFIIEGNINDIYSSFRLDDSNEERIDFCTLNRTLVNLFESDETKGFYNFLFCDPIIGFNDPLGFNNITPLIERCERQIDENKKLERALNGQEKPANYDDNMFIKTSEIIKTLITQADNECSEEDKKSVAIVVNFASRYIVSPEELSNNDLAFYLNLLYASENAIRGKRYVNTLILIVNKFNDVPAWFYLDNPNVRTISLVNPDRFIRDMYISKFFTAFNKDETKELGKLKEKFIDLTDGMKLVELNQIRRLYQKMNVPINEIIGVLNIYKYGFIDSPWEKIRNKVGADFKEKIKDRVKGQDIAVDKIARVIKRSVIGFSGLQHSSENSKPRGILFLAGPTGTGKTEVVKAVAELLFEDERSIIRFDMSEYREEHSDQKLFGAPPGYVGYNSGGQLTNAVKSNPFSILLFDEIEKAHPSIMDKFLQILEDGRLTDGRGETVYFSETIIFFTSNVGISEEIIDPLTGKIKGRKYFVLPGESYQKLCDNVEEAMDGKFKPEVLNRIGDNIVVFNYLDEETTRALVVSKINKINANIQKRKKFNICVSDDVYEKFYALCYNEKTRKHGGRGIGNVLEEYYINPLAEYAFDNNCKENDSIFVDVENEKISFKME